MYKTIFLDLDDTILDFHMAEHIAIGKTFRQLGLEPTPELLDRYSAINQSCWERFERGELTRDEVFTVRFDILFSQLGLGLSSQTCEDIYRKNLGIGHYFIPGAEQALDYLAGKYDLYLASNGVADTQYSRLESAGIGHYFKALFISELTGSHKPDRAYFDYCFARIPDFDPGAAMIIGDSLSSDILGGIQAGIATCWFNYRGKPARPDIRPDFTLTDWSQLPTIL